MNATTELQASARWRQISFWTAVIGALGALVTALYPGLSASQVKSLEDAAMVVVGLILSAAGISIVHAHNAARLALAGSSKGG